MGRGIEAKGIIKDFGRVRALDHASLSASGGMNIVLGPNGAGKSTLLRCIDGLYRPDSGSVRVLGVNPYTNNELKMRLSLLTDNYALYDFLSVRDNLRFFGRLYRLNEEHIERKSREILKRLDALQYMNARVETLSRGTKQKIAFCRAMLSDPEVLLLDEPTAFLDASAANSVRSMLLDMERDGKTIIFVTQKLDEVTRFNGKIFIMRHGRITKRISTSSLYNFMLRESTISVRLAAPVSAEKLKGIKGFVSSNSRDATLAKFKVGNYREVNALIRELLKRGCYIVSVEYVEPLIEKLSVY